MQEPERIWPLLSLLCLDNVLPEKSSAASSWDVSKMIGSASNKIEGDKQKLNQQLWPTPFVLPFHHLDPAGVKIG